MSKMFIFVKQRDDALNVNLAAAAGRTGAVVVGVESLGDFEGTLGFLPKDHSIEKLTIWSHGEPGVLDFRGDRFDVGAIRRFNGKGFADLFAELGPADVGRRHHEVERCRPVARDQIDDAPIAPAGHPRHHGVAIESQERHGGGENAGTLVVGLVQELPRRRCDDRMRSRFAEMRRRHHCLQGGLDRTPGIGQEGRDAGQSHVGFGVEDVQDGADQQRMAGLFQWLRRSSDPSGSTRMSAMF
jgi:hypothetical protein